MKLAAWTAVHRTMQQLRILTDTGIEKRDRKENYTVKSNKGVRGQAVYSERVQKQRCTALCEPW